MNVASIFRDTANQLTTGVGKVINNIVDFFSNLSSGITGLFNSNTPFRQVSTSSKSDEFELVNFCNNIKRLGGGSLSSVKMFLNSQCEMDDSDESECNSIYGSVDSGYNSIYGSVESGYNSIYDSSESGYESTDNPEKHIYEEIKNPEENIYESIEENNLVTVDNTYSEVFDSIDFYEEDIYTSPSGDTLSEENSYDTIPTDDELLRLFLSKIKNGTKFNTL
ncbi:hypothetical protein [Proteus vulgaris]|uniref:hypothetical protein n=1 Tax=Proteus vulgaris TaxID=585 RepID=UPI0018CD6FEE|nr:hypothetical protein [Proteus vulgaris]QPN90922.1 hypothetical protein IM703_06735 [Proteus vulgaris]